MTNVSVKEDIPSFLVLNVQEAQFGVYRNGNETEQTVVSLRYRCNRRAAVQNDWFRYIIGRLRLSGNCLGELTYFEFERSYQ